jgi:F-type H+-transporting ATPase subunit delta
MLKGAVARRYAEAVFDLGVQQGTLDRWMSDLRLIAEAFSNRHFSFVLREPKIPFSRKEAMVRDLLEKHLQPQSLALAVLLVERELVDLAVKIAEAFEQQLNDYRGEANAIVTSAVPLPEHQQREVANYLQALTGKRRINLQTRVNPDILGGIVAQIGDTLIDGSVRRRLNLMRDQIIRGTIGGSEDGGVAATLGNGSGPGSPTSPANDGGSSRPAAGARPPTGKQQGNKSGSGNRPRR